MTYKYLHVILPFPQSVDQIGHPIPPPKYSTGSVRFTGIALDEVYILEIQNIPVIYHACSSI